MHEKITVEIDGKRWNTVSNQKEYDAGHAVIGALLAGADEISIERKDEYGSVDSKRE